LDITSSENDAKIENKFDLLEKTVSRIQKVEEKNEILEQRIEFLEAKEKVMVEKYENLEKKRQLLEEENQILKNTNQNLDKKTKNLEKRNKGIDDDILYLMELSKLNIVRTCEEMARYGVDKSAFYLVDPDGLGGEEPILVFCQFGQSGVASTLISHNSESETQVINCKDPGCYARKIEYNAPMKQIESLIELSESCQQDIVYNCFMSALQKQGIDYGFWLDRNGDSQVYWTGSHHGLHVCSCHYVNEGCFDEENLCNCDALEPLEMSDVGLITNSTALPITELRFGGLESDVQSAFHTLGKLSCSGMKSIYQDVPNPIIFSAIKQDTNSGPITEGQYIDGFERYLTNYGKSFDLMSGTFTAPRGGVFEFSATLLSGFKNPQSLMAIEKNHNTDIKFRTTYGNVQNIASFSWITELEKGDTIRLRVSKGIFYCGTDYNCVFTGKFIRQS